MKRRRYRQAGWSLLIALLLLAFVMTPVSAAGHIVKRMRTTPMTSINATVYLAMATLQPLFQSRIDQQVPGAVNNAIGGFVNKLPPVDRGWAGQMAGALIQPSATLTGMTPQPGGLATTLRLSLYPGDPQPINASMLVKFGVLNSSTVQVSAQPLPGSPTLVNGPLTTLHMPIGQLNSIRATPSCGDAALGVNLQFPVTLGQTAAQGQQAMTNAAVGLRSEQQLAAEQRPAAPGMSAYVEIPSSSLRALGDSIGSLSINNSLTASNIHIGVQGGQLVITSTIALGSSLQIANATTYVQPLASGGSLAVRVVKTDVTVLSVFTFPYNTYNQQIEQTLNAKLNGALGGKFNVTNAAIGSDGHIPCAASDSLLLSGTASLV